MRALAILLAFFLSGCAEYEAQQQAKAKAQFEAHIKVQAAADDVKCQSYGTRPGEQAYIQCRMNLDNQHAQDSREADALAIQYLIAHPLIGH